MVMAVLVMMVAAEEVGTVILEVMIAIVGFNET